MIQIKSVDEIDMNALYQAQVNLLVSYCDTCLDKQQKERILMCQFKSRLLDHALNNSLNADAVDYYNDLCRLLDLQDPTCCTNHSCTLSRDANVCSRCSNGCCSLC